MKILFTILLLIYLLGSNSFAQVKIGLPLGAPDASAVLDLSNMGDGTRGVALPRVANTASILTPVNGLLIYDISSNCTKVYDNDIWSGCLSSSAYGTKVNCAASNINGYYNQGKALTASNTITIAVNNNTSTALTITPSIADIILSGASAGMSVTTVSPASVSPAVGGGSSTITYTLSGTPTAGGSFTSTFTIPGLTCAQTGTVCLAIAPMVVSSTTNPATLPSPTVTGNTIDFFAAGGTPNSGLSWAIKSNPVTGLFSSPATGAGATAQAILIAGSYGLVTATYTAVNACGLSVTSSQGVGVNDLSINAAASAINGFYSQNTALTAANTITIVIVNSGTGMKTLPISLGDIVLSGTGAAGISVASCFPGAPALYPNGGNATITYTLSGTPTSVGTFTATWAKVGLSIAKTTTVCAATAPIKVTNTTSPVTFPYPVVAGNAINFTATGGTPNTTGLSWTMSSSPANMFSNSASGTGNTAQAVLVNGATGTVTVNFNVTNACGLVITGTQTAYITDNLRTALVAAGCASCSAYDAAANNTWVNITAAEYASIDNNMPVNLAACNESIMAAGGSLYGGTGGRPMVNYVRNPGIVTLPINNYVVGFSTYNLSGTSNNASYLKYSQSANTSYNMGGPYFSIPAGTGNNRIYNIMKRPSAVLSTAGTTAMGIYQAAPEFVAYAITTGYGMWYQGMDSPTLPYSTESYFLLYQVKGTASRVW